jgi:CRP-like cAMP-binding protein
VRIDALGTEILVRPGTALIREGDAGRDCFVALDGVATVERGGVPIAAITAGSIAGELAILDRAPRNATVVATTAMRVLVLTPSELSELLNIAPSINATFRQIADTRRTTACCELTPAVRNIR